MTTTPTSVFVIMYNYEVDNYSNRPDWEERLEDEEFYLTRADAEERLTEYEAPIRAEYDTYVAGLEEDYQKRVRDQASRSRANEEQKARNKVLAAAGFSTTPIKEVKGKPQRATAMTYEAFFENRKNRRGQYYSITELKLAVPSPVV